MACSPRTRPYAKLPLLLTPLTYVLVGKAVTAQRKLNCQGLPAEEISKRRSPVKAAGARYLWAALLARIYEVLPLICPHCGAEMRLIAAITDKPSIERILRHIGEPGRPPPSHPGPRSTRMGVGFRPAALMMLSSHPGLRIRSTHQLVTTRHPDRGKSCCYSHGCDVCRSCMEQKPAVQRRAGAWKPGVIGVELIQPDENPHNSPGDDLTDTPNTMAQHQFSTVKAVEIPILY